MRCYILLPTVLDIENEIVLSNAPNEDLGYPVSGPTPLLLDSKAAINLADDPVAFKKTKHILRDYHTKHVTTRDAAIVLARRVGRKANVCVSYMGVSIALTGSAR